MRSRLQNVNHRGMKMWSGRKFFVYAGMAVLAISCIPAGAYCQTPAAAPAATSPASPTATSSFEVSTVKVNTSGSGNSQSSMTNGLYIATNVTLTNLMQYSAYGIPQRRIVNGPKWLYEARFDIKAKMDSATLEQTQKISNAERKSFLQGIFQRLLADRFKMVAHWETRELPVYALVLAKGGSRLQATTLTKSGMNSSSGRGMLTLKGATMADIARTLTQEGGSDLGRDVVDKTDLPGRYDLELKWTPTESDPSAEPGPSIFTAVQEQLGLKLESTKGPVEVLVIDRIEMPSEN